MTEDKDELIPILDRATREIEVPLSAENINAFRSFFQEFTHI